MKLEVSTLKRISELLKFDSLEKFIQFVAIEFKESYFYSSIQSLFDSEKIESIKKENVINSESSLNQFWIYNSANEYIVINLTKLRPFCVYLDNKYKDIEMYGCNFKVEDFEVVQNYLCD